MNGNILLNSDSQYRSLFEDPKEKLITLAHLFDAVLKSSLVSNIQEILKQPLPVRVLIEGSTFPRNIDVVKTWLQKRKNPKDSIVLIDVSPVSIKSHKDHCEDGRYSNVKILQGDMNAIPLGSNSIDVVINDCAVNFNQTNKDNERTLTEIGRVLKHNESSFSLFTVAVDKKYDGIKYGEDQELVPLKAVGIPGSFTSFKTREDGSIELIQGTERKCWSVKYYEDLFGRCGFNYVKFDVETGKKYFPKESGLSFRRYVLTKKRGKSIFVGKISRIKMPTNLF
ncbi:MAG: class I SAM-dependent methyltransferase [Candidatus Shapirobacteria bacterium]|jgi:SAM-dependent methyltransferase